MKQIDRLLLFQGQRCFFCDEPIPLEEASVEHLVATANGGASDDDNCVACCKSLNAAFGSRTYKEKLRAILSFRGRFVCPRKTEHRIETNKPSTPPKPVVPKPVVSKPVVSKPVVQTPVSAKPATQKSVTQKPEDRVALAVSFLKRSGAARPRKVTGLRNSLANVFKKQLSEQELSALLKKLVTSGYVAIKDDGVTYAKLGS